MQDIFIEMEILDIVCFILWGNLKEIRMILLKLKNVKKKITEIGFYFILMHMYLFIEKFNFWNTIVQQFL